MENSTANTESASLQHHSGRSTRDMDLSKSITTALHAVFGFIIGLLMTLVGMKYYGTGTNSFITHPRTMLLFISASFVYTIAVLAEIMVGVADDNSFNLFRYMYLISGTLACELLAFVLAGPFGFLLMNTSALILTELLRRRFHHQIQTFLQQIETTSRKHITGTTTVTEDPEVGQVQMTDR